MRRWNALTTFTPTATASATLELEALRCRRHVCGLSVDKESLRRKEPWMACLEHNDFVRSRPQYRKIVCVDDSRTRDVVRENRVRQLENDRVSRAKPVDVGERCPEGRAMPGDVHEPVLPRQTRSLVTAWPAPEIS